MEVVPVCVILWGPRKQFLIGLQPHELVWKQQIMYATYEL